MVVMVSDEAWSLSLLLDQLSPYMTQLTILDQLYTRGIEPCTDVPSASYKASHLLEEMFTILTDLGNLGKDQHQLVQWFVCERVCESDDVVTTL